MKSAPRARGALAIVVTMFLASCTTFVRPTTCEQGSSACGGLHDARFCDAVAIAVERTDCAALGVISSQHFCVVTGSSCVHTHYVVDGHDCRVLQYRSLRDSSRMDCPRGTPTFVNC